MVRITEDLVRKRAEHNECQISTLEEVSLHQQDIEKLEYLDKWCRDLKILYLQSNLIPKIENVSRLKKLEYLNLALNNIEKIENLEGCESLKKLDLTVNFVGELTSIESLKDLYNFRELFLTGNPCSDFVNYREYVIGTLPQLQWLDGVEIEKSERIKAIQNLPFIRGSILEQQERYKMKRAREKLEAELKSKTEEKNQETNIDDHGSNKENKPGFDGRWYTDISESDKTKEDVDSDKKEKTEKTYEEKVDEFWNEKTKYTPESRLDVHNHLKEIKNKDQKKDEEGKKPPRKLFADDGRPFNVNEPKVDFSLTEDGEHFYLDVAVFKHMDTSLLDCDVQPTYVRVTLKGKILQLCLTEEVNGEKSVAQRSQITGHLVITMPKAKQIVQPVKLKPERVKAKELVNNNQLNSNNYLEVDASVRKGVDVTRIVSDNEAKQKTFQAPFGSSSRKEIKERANSDDFVDDPDVPPLL
ncbi:dynein axonemal assembly factor 11-like [Biomphalaria glabrata]|uniref:Dynein axonemal assembly factor 11-like n=1 Tax=Biomphalaria glabrata TaxID=6526 RepID=A0A9W3AGL3_BIOGL|nr:dynein axonemal assembly factor 11-like [Biomphalaria glabrata]